MKISVVIPAYNCESFIGEAIESVFKQNVVVEEIIVVDDGSEDDTEAVVLSRYPKVKILRQKNSGPSAARNRGIVSASGDWIAFLDADDIWTPNKLEEQLAVLEKYPELKLIASDMAEIDINGKVTIPSMQERHGQKKIFKELDGRPIPRAAAELMKKNFIPTGTVLVERKVLLGMGGFNESLRFGEDLELWARIAAAYPITCLPTVHMLRRRHGSNATSHTIRMAWDLVKVTETVREKIGNALKDQGVDVNRMVSEAWWNLGYASFDQGKYEQSRLAMKASFKEKPNMRAIIYMVLASFPKETIKKIRSFKHGIRKKTG